MANDFQGLVKELALRALEGSGSGSMPTGDDKETGRGGLSSGKGLALGAGMAALAPVAAKKLGDRFGLDGLASPGEALGRVTSNLGESVGSGLGDKVTGKLDEAGGPSGILKDTVKGVLPFGGGDDDDDAAGSDGVRGVGKGRRMPVQQSVDIGLPLETVYNQWTQFEDWPTFMHRVTRVTQEDDCTVSFATKIWGRTREFKAKIETQRPDQRIKWAVGEGITHTGVVTFHELGPNLTRILLGFDVDPGGMLEKMARGMRFIKRAARADLHRFKAFIEIAEHETGAWRGVIEDGEVVEEHDPSYDKKREYSDIEDFVGDDSGDGEDDDDDEPEPSQSRRPRPRASAARKSSSGSGGSSSGRRTSQSKSSGRTGGSSSRSKSGSSNSRSNGSSSSRSSRASNSRSNGSSSGRASSSRSSGSSSGRGRSSSSAKGSSSSSRSGSSSGRSRGSGGSSGRQRSRRGDA